MRDSFVRAHLAKACLPLVNGPRLAWGPAFGWLTILAFVFSPTVAHCQTIAPLLNSVNDQTQTPVEGAGHDYQHLLNETVNFSNGSVSFDINFPIPKGRGITLPYALSYNSGTVNSLNSLDGVTPKWNDNSMFPNNQGWTYKGIPTASVQVFSLNMPTGPPGATLIPCNYQAGMTFTDPSGVQHNLNTAAFASAYNAQGDLSTCGLTQVVLPPGGDGQVAATIWPGTPSDYMTGTDWHSGPFIVEDKNGTIYAFTSQFASSPSSPNLTNEVPDWMEDRNGNIIELSPNAAAGVGTAWSDTLGRLGPTWSGSTLTIGNQTYTANWGTTTSNYNIAVQNPVSGSGILCQGVPTNVTGTHPALQSLTLPNGKKFQFIYGSNGLLTEIIYPDGGWVKYTWQLSSGYNEEASMGGMREMFDQNGQAYYSPVSYGCNSAYQTPELATRTVSFDGTHVAQTQIFAFSTTWAYDSNGGLNGWTQKSATVTTTDNVRNLTSKVVYTYNPMGVPAQPFEASGIATMIPVENTISYYDWGKSSPSRQVTKTWLDQFNLASETTTIYGTTTMTKKASYSYTSGLCANPALSSYVYLTEEDDTDFGSGVNPGPVVKKTIYNYHCFSSANVPTYSQYNTGPWNNYSGVTLVPAISSVTVEDGSGTIHSATQYAYDGTTPSPVRDPVQHDINYDSVSIRGNLTSVTRCTTLPSSPTSSCSGPTTHYTYDYTGQPASMTDPANNTTGYSFADRYTDTSSAPDTNAYLTEIDYPNGLKKDFGYSYSLGYLTESTDFNPGNWTTYSYGTQTANCSYSDTLDRLTEIFYPDGGETTNCYNDGAASVTTSKLLDSTTSTWETSVAYRDGLFHTIQTQLTSDPDSGHPTTVDMSYDGEGLLYSKSNPHRSTGWATDGISYYFYDALGRPIESLEQDGSVLQTCYDGVASTPAVSYCSSSKLGGSSILGSGLGTRIDTTDEAGSHWQRLTDALGRLAYVIEPNGTSQTPTMETDYSYDLLDDLLSVKQWGGAYNCCSSTERVRTFTYDNIGRLLTALNPETGTVTYSYTPGSGYCAGDQSLPCKKTDARGISISYAYDSDNRLLSETYSDSEPTVSFTYDAYLTGGYGTGNYGKGLRTGMTDASGLTTWTYDTMGRPWVETRTIGTVQKQVGTEYGEGGSVKYLHYPSGAKLHYLIGGAGRDLSLHDDTNNIQYALCATYAPPGELATVTMGSSSCSTGGIQDSLAYNSRLQPASQSAISGSTTYLHLTYDFHLGNSDNGNLYAITNVRDSTRSQSFTYDTLNRILTAKTPNPSSHSWGIGFTIDAFGNLTQTSPISGMTNFPMSVNQQVNTKNQFTLLGYGYDAAGEALDDGLAAGCSGHGYSWNAEGMQSCANGTTYTYDGDEERVKKSNGTLYWGGDAGGALAESDLSGNLTAEYIFFNGQRIAMRNASTHVVSYYVLDHLGSTSVLADAAGNIINDSDYTPYGGEIPFTSGNPGQHYKFTGKERDTESGNDYFGARYYGSSMARMLSPDPLGGSLANPQSLNRYAYALNNPLRFTDPTGMYVTNCASGDKACAKNASAFEKSRRHDLKSKNAAIRGAAGAYGDPGQKNGVTVAFGDPGKGKNGTTVATGLQADPNHPGKFQADATVTIRPGQSGSELDSTVGHEGQHVEDAQGFAATVTPQGYYDLSKNLHELQTEINAYGITNAVLSDEGVRASFGTCGNGPCVLGFGVTNPDATIRQLLANPANGYGVTGANPGPRQFPEITTPNPVPQ